MQKNIELDVNQIQRTTKALEKNLNTLSDFAKKGHSAGLAHFSRRVYRCVDDAHKKHSALLQKYTHSPAHNMQPKPRWR